MSFRVTVDYMVVDCPREGCHIQFAISQDYDGRKRNDHTDFFCPNGHPMSYGGRTKAERERDEAKARAARLQAQLDQANARERDLKQERTNLKGQLTKAKKRAANGTCPCCKRTFKNVQRHLKSQYPDYVTAHLNA